MNICQMYFELGKSEYYVMKIVEVTDAIGRINVLKVKDLSAIIWNIYSNLLQFFRKNKVLCSYSKILCSYTNILHSSQSEIYL